MAMAALALACPFAGMGGTAEDVSADALPPAAKASFDRGARAVEAGDWELATRYFAEARKSAPVSSAITLNLGLGYAKSGQDPLAIAWLSAFAAAEPQSPKAAAARQEIERLKAEAKKKLRALLQAATAAIEQREGDDRPFALCRVAETQAGVGLLEDALATLERPAIPKEGYWATKIPTDYTARLLCAYAGACLESGDLRQAVDTLGRIRQTGVDLGEFSEYGERWKSISLAFCAQGDFERAWRAAQQIPASASRAQAMAQAAELRLAEGDFIPAESALSVLKDEYTGGERSQFLKKVALACARQKDFDRARQMAAQMTGSYEKADTLAAFCEAQLKTGDVQGARATALQILSLGEPADVEDRYQYERGIGVGTAMFCQAVLGQYDRALALASKLKDDIYNPDARFGALGRVVYCKAVYGGDLRAAVQMANSLAQRYARGFPDNPYEKTNILYAELAAAQLKLGRLNDALATVKIPRSDRSHMDYRISEFVRELVDAGRLDTAAEMAAVLRTSGNPYVGGQLSRAARHLARGEAARGNGLAAEKLASEYPTDVNTWIALAAGYRSASAMADAARALATAAKCLEGLKPDSAPLDIGLPDWWWGARDWMRTYDRPLRDEVLARIAQLLVECGGASGAVSTGTLTAAVAYGQWISLIEDSNFQRDIVKLDEAINDARASKSPDEMVRQLCDAAHKLGRNLARVEALDRKLSSVNIPPPKAG